ncbi:MAG: hypothetical protein M0T75_11665 [Chloroflexi bacterium]|nr:hypothetical protein [Chloroflexota bacterium]
MNVVPLRRLVAERGLDVSAEPVVRGVLAEAGLLVHDGVDGATLPAVRALLDERLATSCGSRFCDELGPALAGGPVVRGREDDCRVCRGSEVERARARVAAACRATGIRRLLVVGGSPRSCDELKGDRGAGPRGAAGAPEVEWRFVDGVARPNPAEAKANVAWAEVIVIWATTLLDHKVSTLYTNPPHPRRVTCAQRSAVAPCDTIVRAITGDDRPTSEG